MGPGSQQDLLRSTCLGAPVRSSNHTESSPLGLSEGSWMPGGRGGGGAPELYALVVEASQRKH